MKKSRVFTTIDMVTVVTLLISIVSLAGAVIASVALDSSVIQARLGAEKLARQLLSGGLEVIDSERDNRRLASLTPAERLELLGSAGLLSRDPWGRPYSYRIGRDQYGRTVAVVWSNGPNGKKDSPDSLTEGDDLSRVQFFNDDVGYIFHREPAQDETN